MKFPVNCEKAALVAAPTLLLGAVGAGVGIIFDAPKTGALVGALTGAVATAGYGLLKRSQNKDLRKEVGIDEK